jgi:Ala-tRNA(Pro) deacylase
VLDAGLMENAVINCHPLVNTMTTSVARDGLLKFFAATGHTPRIEPVAGARP